MANKKNSKKQVKTNKVVKATTPAEEIKDVDVEEETKIEKAENKEKAKESKIDKSEKKSKSEKKDTKKDSKKSDDKSKKRWFKDFKAELKKVIWPTGKELWSNTAIVIIMVVIVSVLIFLLDLAFGALNKFEVKQIEKIKNKTSDSIVENVSEENQTIGDNTTETETTEVDLTPQND